MKEDIIIVGAGASGLLAARELSENGMRVLVLESEGRTGGRIHTVKDASFPVPLELGAEFVHGKLPLTLSLLDEAGIKYVEDTDGMIKIRDGKWSRSEDFIEGWNEMLEKMKSVKMDMSLRSFLDLYYKQEKYATLRKEVIRFAEGFDLADVNLVSMQFLSQEWRHENDVQYRIPGGYRQLTDFLAEKTRENGGRILTGVSVNKVEWKNGEVRITATDGKSFTSAKVLITVPVGVIQKINSDQNIIEFNPSVSTLLKNTQYIGFGSVIKYFALFDNFFSSEINKPTMLLTDGKIPTWWVKFFGETIMLTGWVGGPPAVREGSKSKTQYREDILKSLSAVFNVNKNELEKKLRAIKVVSWAEHQSSYGAYSYEMVGSKEIKKLMRQPISGTVYFAGEGLHDGEAPGTVEAALLNAKEVVKKLIGSWKFNKV